VSADPVLQSAEDKLVQLVIKLTQAENRISTTPVTKDDTKLLKKSLTGRFPVLEMQNGVAVSDTLPIARVLAKEAPSFVGLEEDGSRQQVDMWVDFINHTVLPASAKVIAQCTGTAKVAMD
jgi:glutathione S-transferase